MSSLARPEINFAKDLPLFETDIRYAVTSLALKASEILREPRLHWGIETGFHRCLDVAFREDASAIWLRNVTANSCIVATPRFELIPPGQGQRQEPVQEPQSRILELSIRRGPA